MSDTIEAPVVETNDAPVDRFAGVEFGSESGARQNPERTEAAPEQRPSTEADAKQEAVDNKPAAWELRRISSLTGKWKGAEERAAAAEQRVEEYRRALAAARGEQQPSEELTPDQIRQQERETITRQQAQQREAEEFGAATQRVAQSLTEAHGAEAIQAATRSLVERAGLDFDNKSHQQIIRDISELPNSGAVYYALANDPDAASALLDAPERKQFAMLQKFADKATASSQQAQASQPARSPVPAVSKAPPPVAATSGSARTVSGRSIYDNDLSMDDYIKLRSKK